MGFLPRVLIFPYGPFIPMICMVRWSGISCLCNYDEGRVQAMEFSTLLVEEVVRRDKIEIGEECGVCDFLAEV